MAKTLTIADRFARLRKALKAKDEAGAEQELSAAEAMIDDDEGDAPQKLVIELQAPAPAVAAEAASDEGEGGADPVAARFDKIEAALTQLGEAVAALKPAAAAAADEGGETEEERAAREAADADPEESEEVEKSTAMDALAKAEILAPGIKLPTFDGAKVKGGVLIALKRQALKKGYAADAKSHIDAVLGARKPEFDTMKASVVSVVFDGAAALAKSANNGAFRARPADMPQGPMTAAKMQTLIEQRRKPAA